MRPSAEPTTSWVLKYARIETPPLALARRLDHAVLDHEDLIGGVADLGDRVAALEQTQLRALAELGARGVVELAEVAVRAHVRRDRARVIDALEVLAHRAVAAAQQIEAVLLELEQRDVGLRGDGRGALAAAEQRRLAEVVALAIEATEPERLALVADHADADRALEHDEHRVAVLALHDDVLAGAIGAHEHRVRERGDVLRGHPYEERERGKKRRVGRAGDLLTTPTTGAHRHGRCILHDGVASPVRTRSLSYAIA